MRSIALACHTTPEVISQLLAASMPTPERLLWPGERRTLYLELLMRFSPAIGAAGPRFVGSRNRQARQLWEDVVALFAALGGPYPALLGGLVAMQPPTGGFPPTMVDALVAQYPANAGGLLEVRLLEAIGQPGTGTMAARLFTDRAAGNAINGAQTYADAAARPAGSLTVHVWPDATRMVRAAREAKAPSSTNTPALAPSTARASQTCADQAAYNAVPFIQIVVCDFAGAARRGNLPPGWLEHNLFIGSSPAARIAMVLHTASNAGTQRAVGEVSRQNWRSYFV